VKITNTFKVGLAFSSLCIVWGTTYFGIRYAIQYIQPFMLSGLRHVIAGLVFFSISLFQGEKLPNKTVLWQVTIMGLLLIVGGNGLVCWAEQFIPSALTAIICSLSPIFITLMSLYFFKGFHINYKIVIGLFLGLFGIGLIFSKDLSITFNSTIILALLVLLVAILCWGLGSILLKKNPLPISLFMSLGLQMLIAGSVNILISGFLEDNSKLLQTDTKGILALLYLVVFGSLIGYSCYLYVLGHYTAARISIHSYINTLIAVFVGWLLGGETMNEYIILGTFIVLTGLIIVNKEYAKMAKSIEILKKS
jgi:drug/metabolite transporter (DMT)-like permease